MGFTSFFWWTEKVRSWPLQKKPGFLYEIQDGKNVWAHHSARVNSGFPHQEQRQNSKSIPASRVCRTIFGFLESSLDWIFVVFAKLQNQAFQGKWTSQFLPENRLNREKFYTAKIWNPKTWFVQVHAWGPCYLHRYQHPRFWLVGPLILLSSWSLQENLVFNSLQTRKGTITNVTGQKHQVTFLLGNPVPTAQRNNRLSSSGSDSPSKISVLKILLLHVSCYHCFNFWGLQFITVRVWDVVFGERETLRGCGLGHSEANAVLSHVELSVETSDEHISEDPQGPHRFRHVQRHKAAQADCFAHLGDLQKQEKFKCVVPKTGWK